jgi:DNA-binding MurR/RpiR family transcriptional regulator
MSSLLEALSSGLTGSPRPLFPGAVALIVRDGVPGPVVTVGEAVRYADADGSLVPPGERVAMNADTVFDVASLTKLFTATVLMRLVQDGRVALDAPIGGHLPSFRNGERQLVTLRHLLTHTSGLPALLRLWTGYPDRASRKRAVLQTGLERPPGTSFVYSDVGFLVAGFLAEKLTRRRLPTLVQELVCRPLGLRETGHRPSRAILHRIAATEYQPDEGRGMVRGSVHDENSWSLGGTVGHAGIFSTAADLARFAEAMRNGGALDGVRVLEERSVAEMFRNQLPPGVDPGHGQGIGFRIGDPKFMGPLAATPAVGHTGFTGTSLVIDPDRRLVVLLLTNRVHPSRTWSDLAEVRRRVAEIAAEGPRPRRSRPPARPSRTGRGTPEETPRNDAGRGLLVRIRAALPALRASERRVAEAVLADPAGVAVRSIGALARQCNTSGATVLRFCHAVGYGHYPDLRIALAREASREESREEVGIGPGPRLTGDIGQDDTLAEIVAKITYSDARAIEDTAATLDLAALGDAVDAVARAVRIDIYGIGASGFVAQDLHQKLHRIGLLSSVWPDPHAALTSAALLGPADVAVAISHTGTTIDTIEALRVARSRGATTIAITNFGDSPLTEHARHVLTTAARETTFRSGAMASRIAQLAVIDCLFVGVAQRSYERTMVALEATYAAIQGKRVANRRRASQAARNGS